MWSQWVADNSDLKLDGASFVEPIRRWFASKKQSPGSNVAHSAVVAGLWTQQAAFTCGVDDSPFCLKCGVVGTTRHRLSFC